MYIKLFSANTKNRESYNEPDDEPLAVKNSKSSNETSMTVEDDDEDLQTAINLLLMPEGSFVFSNILK